MPTAISRLSSSTGLAVGDFVVVLAAGKSTLFLAAAVVAVLEAAQNAVVVLEAMLMLLPCCCSVQKVAYPTFQDTPSSFQAWVPHCQENSCQIWADHHEWYSIT